MGKVIISFLGTGTAYKFRAYRKANYSFDGTKLFETSFIADFLIQELRPKKVYLFGTPKSMWEEVYNCFSTQWNYYNAKNAELFLNYVIESTKETKIDEPDFFQLLSNSTHGITILPRLIHYGLNERELKINSEKILSIGAEIDPNDEVYIDITHAFRSIPMYALLLVGLLRQLKGLKVKDIYYGMLEATGEVGYTPVVSLFPLIQLFDWISAAKSFNDFGSSRGLINLMKQNNIGVSAIKSAQKWAISQQLNDNKAYKEASYEFVRELSKLDQNNIPSELKLITPYLKKFPTLLSSENVEWRRLVMLSKHNQKSDNIGLAVLNLWEATVSRFEDILEVKVENNHDIYRRISKFLRGVFKNEDLELLKKLVNPNVHFFFDNCVKISTIRNAVAHGNGVANETSIKTSDKVDYTELITDIGKLLDCISKELHNVSWDENRSSLKRIFNEIE